MVCGGLLCLLQQHGRESNVDQRLSSPLFDVGGCVALCLTRHQSNQRLLNHPRFGNAILDELDEYLALPQMKFKDDWGVQEWWRENASKFPNLEVMARQYLGCPSTSASVERLFSHVGLSFSASQRRSTPDLVADRMFAHANMP